MENSILVATIAVLIVLERLPSLRFEPRSFFRPFFRDDLACFLTGGVVLALLVRAVVGPVAGAVPLPLPLAVVAALVLYDLGGWLSHRLLHRFEPLWEIHKVHHSSLALDWLAAFRAHILEHGLRHVVSIAPLVWLGFPPLAIGTAAAVYASWAAFNHSNFRPPLRFLEPLLVTPRLHRLHHVPATSERNFGTIFSVWDRLAGRLHADPAAAASPLGVSGELARYPQTWWAFTLEPAKRLAPRRARSRPAAPA